MRCMFYACSNLKELNLSNFNTQNVTCKESMFKECTSLEKYICPPDLQKLIEEVIENEKQKKCEIF